MLSYFRKFFDFNVRELDRLKRRVDAVNALEDTARALGNDQFAKETASLKKKLESGESLDSLLPWAFALTREAARRTIGQRHYDVQLLAGIALHEGKVTEQKTGEGKTLAATAPLYLNALLGKGAHLVTVNDYLARRDAGWNGQIFQLLGLQTAAIVSGESFIFDPSYTADGVADARLAHLRPVSRQEAYKADITYGINSEFGFDYLRDNMAVRRSNLSQRGFYYAIIDEADSVLIDEARTPHIISAPYEEDTSKYYQYAKLVSQLSADTDYVIDEKLRSANLTEAGIQKIESLLGIDNVYEQDFDSVYHVEAALKARTLFHKEKEYIVRNGEVVIVDEFTGRLLTGRRFSEGLHQAIEAKENVAIQRESRTLATVSLQNYFRMYEKLAGMTGTAATEAEEFHKIYTMDVVVVPTHRDMVRQDHPDMIYKTERAKVQAVVEEIAGHYKAGRPVLVGTTSIDKNEQLSRELHKRGIPHELLNAKNHEREAQIIARAGEKGAVTVATNMAGRGVDIILGGATPEKLDGRQQTIEQARVSGENGVESIKSKVSPTQQLRRASERDDAEYKKAMAKWQEAHDEVVTLGGLMVIGTERHESRRIDNQLRGRSGRQGDPGETRFFVSLEDDLMRIFGGEQISNLMNFLKFPEDQPLSHRMVTRAIEQAQVKVEGHNFDIRKHLVEFDDVLNKQREIIYTLRRKLLFQPEEDKSAFRDTIFEVIAEQITSMLQSYRTLADDLSDSDTQTLVKDLGVLFPAQTDEISKYLSAADVDGLEAYLLETVESIWRERESKVGAEIWYDAVRQIFLSTVDQFWTQHLTAIDDLRDGINLRGYAQLDPLVEYKNEAFSLFERLVSAIDFESTRRLLRSEIAVKHPEQTEVQKPKKLQFQAASAVDPFHEKAERKSSQQISSQSSPSQKKPGRNDPCWCGSGKKYKKCHLDSDRG